MTQSAATATPSHNKGKILPQPAEQRMCVAHALVEDLPVAGIEVTLHRQPLRQDHLMTRQLDVEVVDLSRPACRTLTPLMRCLIGMSTSSA